MSTENGHNLIATGWDATVQGSDYLRTLW